MVTRYATIRAHPGQYRKGWGIQRGGERSSEEVNTGVLTWEGGTAGMKEIEAGLGPDEGGDGA